MTWKISAIESARALPAGWPNGVPLLVRYVSQEPRYVEVMKEVESELAVPLISENKVLGVLNVDSGNRAAFSEDDLKLLVIYAGHTASLIKNARLYGQVMTERNFRENILESSPNSVIAVNMKKEITSINRRTEELFRLKRKNVLGQKVPNVFGAEIVQLVDLAVDQGDLIDYKEIRKSRKDGSQLTLGVTSSWLRDHQGNLIGVIFIVRDLTEGKRTEELIRRMDRLTSIGQLSAGIAHEIRNPLASISLNVQMLSKKLALDTPPSILSPTPWKASTASKAWSRGCSILPGPQPRRSGETPWPGFCGIPLPCWIPNSGRREST